VAKCIRSTQLYCILKVSDFQFFDQFANYCFRIIGKFIQTYFALDDNVLDKKLLKLVNEKTFTSKKNVKQVIIDIIQSFADIFCNGDQKKAKE
jgi:hypothetical protein